MRLTTFETEKYADDDGRTVYTVNAIDPFGEKNDLNAEGEPIYHLGELQHFVGELLRQGAFDVAGEINDRLMEETFRLVAEDIAA